MTTALIDLDPIVYSSGFVGEHHMYYMVVEGEDSPRTSFETKTEAHRWAEDVGLEKKDYKLVDDLWVEPLENVLNTVKRRLASIMEQTRATSYRGFLTGGDQFRKVIYPEYKANRKTPKPVYYEEIRDYLVAHHDAEVIDVYEADDALATCQKDTTVICTVDKDLLQVPGSHYNYVTGEHTEVEGFGTLKLSKDSRTLKGTGLKFYYAQMLMGDDTDNIKGVPKMGPAGAYKLLDPLREKKAAAKVVRSEYQKAFGEKKWKTQLDLHRKLLWMHRDVPNLTRAKSAA